MSDFWSGLTRDNTDQPTSLPPITRGNYKLLAKEDHELTPAQLAKRQAARRRPNEGLPFIQNPWNLTPIQARVISMIADGWENVYMAEELDIARATIEVHVQRVKERMGGVNRVKAAVLWDRFIRGAQ